MKIDFKIREITERKPEIHRNKNGKENEIQELVATTVNNSAGTRMKNQKLEEI